MTPLEQIRYAWNSIDRVESLNRTVERLAREGISREILDDSLGSLLDLKRDHGMNEADEELIAAVGDRLHGWCHESRAIPVRSAADTTTVTVNGIDSTRTVNSSFVAR